MIQRQLWVIVILAALPFSVSAGSLAKKVIKGGVVVAAGAAIIHAAKKACQPVRNVETGLYECVRPAEVGSNEPALKNASTYELRKALNVERTSAGLPPDPEGCDAHHIVPKNENRPWASELVGAARDSLQGCVEIDSAENGIYLPGRKSGAGCSGQYHKSLHTKKYYSSIQRDLSNALDFDGCEGVKRVLREFKDKLSVDGGIW